MSGSIWIKNAAVVTLDAARRVIDPGDVVIEDGRIVAVGPSGEIRPDNIDPGSETTEIIDARERILLPGLVNAHIHSYAGLLKGTVDRTCLDVFMLYVTAASAERRPRDAYLSAMIGCIEMLKTGTTGVLDHCPNRPLHKPELLDAEFQAYADSGMRAAVAPMFGDLPYLDTVPVEPGEMPDDLAEGLRGKRLDRAAYFAAMRHVLGEWQGHEGRLGVLLGVDGVQRCSDDLLRETAAFAAEHGIGLHSHMLETKTQMAMAAARHKDGFTGYLAELGLLGEKSSLAHFVWASDRDIEIVREAGATVVHAPASNLFTGAGIAPVQKLRRAGIPVAVSSDGVNTGNMLMLEKTRLAAMLARATEPDYKNWFDAGDALEMATANGARALGYGGALGRIEPGQIADLALYDTRSLQLQPRIDPMRQLCFYESGYAVDTVLVGGEVMVRDGRLTQVDEDTLLGEANEAAQRLLRDNAGGIDLAERRIPHIHAMAQRIIADPCGVHRFADGI
jgi:cytosine/adenosine deaminase-related metal-dependent hydrolase